MSLFDLPFEEPEPEPEPERAPVVEEPPASEYEFASEPLAFEPLGATDDEAAGGDAPVFEPFDSFEPLAEPEPLAVFDPSSAPVVPEGDAGLPAFDSGGLLADESEPATEDPADAAEIARQLANLSPKAAKAVAAAAKATTDEEREEALAALDGEDTSLNRDLLLKFLGSVNP